MNKKDVRFITVGAIIAALYTVLTCFINVFNLANGMIQVRISEALTVLPFFTPAAIPGLTIGCVISNLYMGNPIPDIVFGSLATLLGAIGTYLLARIPLCKKNKGAWICTLPPVIANGLIIPFVLRYAYKLPNPLWQLAAGVVAGEIICCCILGGILLYSLRATPLAHELSATE